MPPVVRPACQNASTTARLDALKHQCRRQAGSGKLTQALGITIAHNGAPLDKEPFAIHRRTTEPDIITGKRIGISKAIELPWRYGLKCSRF